RIGELVRAYILSLRKGVTKTATLATIVVERIFDGITMIGFAAGAVLYIILTDHDALITGADHKLGTFLSSLQVPAIILTTIFLALLVVFLVIAASRSRTEAVINGTLRFVPGRFRERAEKIAHSFVDGLGSLRSGRSLGAVLLLSLVAWLFETSMYFVIGNLGFDLRSADGQPLPFYVYVLVCGVVNLSGLLPQAPGALGVFEFVGQSVLVGAFGVEQSQSISFVLVLHVALLLPITLLGIYYMTRQSIAYRDLIQLEETRASASEQAHELEGPLTDIELVQEGKIPEGEQGRPTIAQR
ncbi:MAG: lysylphosphatidylglycerol synthase transmembrane domain-containing protein, partial [Chloroflexota bacterium]